MAFGRRTAKRCIRAATGSAHISPAQQIQEESWLWQGATMAVQSRRYADGRREHLSWHYTPGSFTPLAVSRQINDDASTLLYVVSDHLGTPRELVNANGQVVWAAQLQTWGKLNRCWQQRAANDADQIDIDLRFPNQWHDPESGLHYNYQRYYDPEIGQYCSPDPIGIAGGLRPQGYVHNPGEWCDPLGLAACSVNKALRELDQGAANVTVGSRSDAAKVFMDRYLGENYRNMTGESGPSTKNLMEYETGVPTKNGTYHWDEIKGSDGRVAGHGPLNPDGDLPHLQIHEKSGNVIHIFFPWER